MGFKKGNKLGVANKGRKRTPEWSENQRKAKLGKHYSPNTEFKKGSVSWTKLNGNPKVKNLPHAFKKGQTPWNKDKLGVQVGVRGARHHNWKGGKTGYRQKIHNTLEYKLWRRSVFERDNYTCRFCGERGGELNADHIKPFAYFPELRLAIDNGRTLCVACHRKTDTWGYKISKKLK